MGSGHGNKQKHESKNPLQRAVIARFQSSLAACVRQAQPRSVLDVGCGEGYSLDALTRHGVRTEMHGVDLSAEAIADARVRLGDRATLEVRDARTLADAGRTFDLVMMTEVLEHLDEPQAMLPVLESLTTRWVLLSVPWEPFFRGINLVRLKNVDRFGSDPEHLQHWSRRSFIRFVGSRFDVVRTPQVFPWTMVLARRRGAP